MDFFINGSLIPLPFLTCSLSLEDDAVENQAVLVAVWAWACRAGATLALAGRVRCRGMPPASKALPALTAPEEDEDWLFSAS